MNTYEQKISLLSEMIEFAKVDGELHEREMEFLSLVARELSIDKPVFIDLFRQQSDIRVIKSEAQRIHQFYRLALLMHVDGKLHQNEHIAIRQLGINMGLSPAAMNRVLDLMKTSPTGMVEPELVVAAFKEQQN
ncbi:Excinuclease ABC subunit B [Flavobacterium longum]|uniref:TerB family tellurite resistance protein n=1 Tax=Flavobacterium longum TaxID=1299340 RepID=UPI0039EB5256